MGAQIPETWTGVGEYANRSSSENLAEPAIKHLTRRQKYIICCLKQIIDYTLKQAQDNNLLNKYLSSAKNKKYLEYKVIAPDMSVKDTSRIASAFSQITAGVMQARDNGWINDAEASDLMHVLLAGLGSNV